MNWKYYPDTATSPAFYQSGDYRIVVQRREFRASFTRAKREPWFGGPYLKLSEAFAACEARQKQYHQSLYCKP